MAGITQATGFCHVWRMRRPAIARQSTSRVLITWGRARSLLEQRPDSCASTTTQDDALLDAIVGIEEWSYQTYDRITLIGTNGHRLARAPPRNPASLG